MSATWTCISTPTAAVLLHRHPQPLAGFRDSRSDGTGLRQVTQGEEPDIDNYDADVSAGWPHHLRFHQHVLGVPCVGGADYVGQPASDERGRHRRPPAVLRPGQRLVSDDAAQRPGDVSALGIHRLRALFQPRADVDEPGRHRPDASSTAAIPTGRTRIFYARPLPGSSDEVCRHRLRPPRRAAHGRNGAVRCRQGRQEDTGAIQRIPGYGKPVKGIIKDTLVNDSWPKFLHPYPLSDKYFLVSCKPTPQADWGIYWWISSTTCCCSRRSRATPCSSRCRCARPSARR